MKIIKICAKKKTNKNGARSQKHTRLTAHNYITFILVFEQAINFYQQENQNTAKKLAQYVGTAIGENRFFAELLKLSGDQTANTHEKPTCQYPACHY